MKKLIIALLLMTLVASANAEYVLCNPTSQINIRSKPSSHASLEGWLDCGDYVEYDRIARDNQGRRWVHLTGVVLENTDGWVLQTYLVSSPVEQKELRATVRSKGRVAIRKSPNGERKGWAKNGKSVTILAWSEDWSLTNLGYIDSRYLEVDNRG